MVGTLGLNAVVIASMKKPPENLQTFARFNELHPTQALAKVKNRNSRKILNFTVQPPSTVTFNTAL
jgi:hypothetical protein